MLERAFQRAYRRALKSPRRFFTNQCEFECGSATPEVIIYFIHGLGGAPGQAALLSPTIKAVLNRSFLIRAMHIPELDVHREFSDRYTLKTAGLIRDKVLADLEVLAETYAGRKIFVALSSHAMYDFVYAYPQIPESIRRRCVLIWLACASDEYEKLAARYRWILRISYWFNGFERDGYRWAYHINHNWLRFINPETCTSFSYHDEIGNRITYLKREIEMRFKYLGFEWTDPTSVQFVRDYLQLQTAACARINDIKCYALVASHDGYWHTHSEETVRATIARYLRDFSITFAPTSHLWCVTPPFARPFLESVFSSELPEDP